MAAARDWSGLPPDLLGMIINRLPIPCCLRVRAVCRSWSLAVAGTPYCPANPQSPWLIATEEGPTNPPQLPWWLIGTEEDEDIAPELYDLSERRSYHLNRISGIPRCVASSHGWLVFIDKVSELHLFNPITGARIPLPSVTTFPDIICAERDSLDGRIAGYVYLPSSSKYFPQDPQVIDHRYMLSYYHQIKAFTDRHSKNITVFVFRGVGLGAMRNRLSYASSGDETWTEVPESRIFGGGMGDFAFHKGKFHGVFRDGRLMVIDNLTSPLENLRQINSGWPDILNESFFLKERFYLVDSADGKDLLLVIRDAVRYDPSPVKSSFLVLKLDLDSEESGWIVVRRLKETAIFLGENTSMALSTRDLPELKENCIYFTDIKSHSHSCGGDEGIFHLENQTISPLFRDDDPFLLPLRHWFMPAL